MAQPNGRRGYLGLLASGLLGWTVEAWLCLVFWNQDAGIGGGPMLLFGPPLVMMGTCLFYHVLSGDGRLDSSRTAARRLFTTLNFRCMAFWVTSYWLGIWAWKQWFESVEQSLDMTKSRVSAPAALHVIAWSLTLLAIVAVVYAVRDALKPAQKSQASNHVASGFCGVRTATARKVFPIRERFNGSCVAC